MILIFTYRILTPKNIRLKLLNFHNLTHIYMKLSQFIIVVNNITSTIENSVMAKYKILRYPKICIASIGRIVEWDEACSNFGKRIIFYTAEIPVVCNTCDKEIYWSGTTEEYKNLESRFVLPTKCIRQS
jgi:hypothetical protein